MRFCLISFYLLIIYNMEKTTTSIADRLNILADAEQFFADLSDAWENACRLGKFKAMALGTVKDCLQLYQDKMMDWKEWTEEDLEKALDTIVNESLIDMMVDNNKMSEDEADFYRWGFGLSIGIVQDDKETLDWLREQMDAYENILQTKIENKTLKDLLS